MTLLFLLHFFITHLFHLLLFVCTSRTTHTCRWTQCLLLLSVFIQETETAALKFRCLDSYLHWKNINSLCWLHSLLSLIVHNVTLSTLTHNVDSLLRTLTDSFNKAQELSSVNREQAEKGLQAAREKVWKYLQPKMKCEHGVNDSPVTALPLLLRENCTLLEKTLQSYQWKFSCCICGYRQVDK